MQCLIFGITQAPIAGASWHRFWCLAAFCALPPFSGTPNRPTTATATATPHRDTSISSIYGISCCWLGGGRGRGFTLLACCPPGLCAVHQQKTTTKTTTTQTGNKTKGDHQSLRQRHTAGSACQGFCAVCLVRFFIWNFSAEGIAPVWPALRPLLPWVLSPCGASSSPSIDVLHKDHFLSAYTCLCSARTLFAQRPDDDTHGQGKQEAVAVALVVTDRIDDCTRP